MPGAALLRKEVIRCGRGAQVRAALGMAAVALAVAQAPEAANAQAAVPAAHALVVGIDDYVSLRRLQGAANDARDIFASLRSNGVSDAVLLLDRQATRDAIFVRFRELAARAKADGGWLIFAYAGHGGQEPERLAGDEADGKDESFLLSGYANQGSPTAERILDNDIFTLFSQIDPKVRILFIADSCHSGTMTRSVDPRTAKYESRDAAYGPIVDDALPPPPASTKGRSYAELPNVIFVASSTDAEATVEIPIDGKARGAVSWHMARAFGGAADSSGDGVTTFSELRRYIGESARMATENRQHPSVNYLAGREGERLPFGRGGGASAAPAAELPRIGVWTIGPAQPDFSQIPGATPAASRQAAELVWDPARGQVLNNGLGDVVAERPAQRSDLAFLSGVAGKWRALKALKLLRSDVPLRIEIGPLGDGARYTRGTVTIALPAIPPDLPYLTVVNLAGDGTVQNLFPKPGDPVESGRLPPGGGPRFSNVILPPYGADHVIAIATQTDPAQLRSRLQSLEQLSASTEAYAAIRDAVRNQRHAIGIAGIYTGINQGE